jgi:hypothetical protein
MMSVAGLVIAAPVSGILNWYGETWAAPFPGLIPLFLVTVTLMNALLYADEPGSFDSGYYRQAFTLPVSTRELAAWPMIYGVVAMVLSGAIATWVLIALGGLEVPAIALPLGLAALMAWLQVIAWSPFAFFRFKILPICFILIPVAMLVGVKASTTGLVWSSFIVLFLSASLPLAYAVATLALRSARRGESWRLWPWTFPTIRLGVLGIRRRHSFGSPIAAQTWFDRRCHGLYMPGTVVLISLFVLLMLIFSRMPLEPFGLKVLFAMTCACPIACAAFGGMQYGLMHPFWIKEPRSSDFVITRPIASRDIARSKFRMIARTALASCAILIFSWILEISLSGSVTNFADLWGSFTERYPGWRGPLITGLAVFLLPLFIWTLATQMLPFGLAGRQWIQAGVVFLSMFGLGFAAWLVSGVQHGRIDLSRPLGIVPWVLALALAAKLAVAVWASRECLRRRLMTMKDGAGIVVTWACISCLVVIFVLLIFPLWAAPLNHVFGCVAAVLLVPLGRFPLSVLAFEWNRHR